MRLFFLILSVSNFGIDAQAQGLPSCADTTLEKDTYCLDAKGRIAFVQKIKVKKNKTVMKSHPLNRKELQEYELEVAREKIRVELNELKGFCTGLTDRILERDQEIKNVREKLSALTQPKAHLDVDADIANLRMQLSDYEKNSVDCDFHSVTDVNKPQWYRCNTDCLQKALASCPDVISRVQKRLQNFGNDPNERNRECVDCGGSGVAIPLPSKL